MRKTSILKFICMFLGSVLALYLLLTFFCWFARPKVLDQKPEYSEQELKEAERVRDVSFDTENPLIIHREVDYSEGQSAAWYPKKESPILADLVSEGKLPPVHERMGEEPLVLEGVDGTGRYGGTLMRLAVNNHDI